MRLLVSAWAILIAVTVLLASNASEALAQSIPPDSQYVQGTLSTASPYPLKVSQNDPFVGGVYDTYGRFVLLHGVNAVYKHPPYELEIDPGADYNFSAKDAQQIANLGFNLVRLGVIWKGIEPGTARANDPSICGSGALHDPGQWNQTVANDYISHLMQVVDLLGQYHVYSLIDMHQDVYNEAFEGEGAPNWAVCTSGKPIKKLSGRWSNNYGSASLNAAFKNFWTNDVSGDLQGEYDRAWSAIASAFASNPWVAGYDPINEPFTTSLTNTSHDPVSTQLECLYSGTMHPGSINGKPIVCPTSDPTEGIVPTIQAVDPHHLIFLEPTIYESNGRPNYVGSLPYPNLVLNFHSYCGNRSPVTGNPYSESSCMNEETRHFLERARQVTSDASAQEQSGPPLFLSEFGATQSSQLIGDVTFIVNGVFIGWAYWSWKYYRDPTGSSAEALVSPDGKIYSTAAALSESYPTAIAGRPEGLVTRDDGGMDLEYVANPNIRAPTVIFVATKYHPRTKYCVRVTGGATVVSNKGATWLLVENPTSAGDVDVRVDWSGCPA